MTVSKTLRATAYHEAGHAIAAHELGFRVRKATILPDEKAQILWHVLLSEIPKSLHPDLCSNSDRLRLWAENRIIISMAGSEAQRLVTRKWKAGSEGEQLDYVKFCLKCCDVKSIEEAQAYLNWLWIRTRSLVMDSHWNPLIHLIADQLEQRQTLTGREIGTLIREA